MQIFSILGRVVAESGARLPNSSVETNSTSPWGNSVGERAHRHVGRGKQSVLHMGNAGWRRDSLNTQPTSRRGTYQKYVSQVSGPASPCEATFPVYSGTPEVFLLSVTRSAHWKDVPIISSPAVIEAYMSSNFCIIPATMDFHSNSATCGPFHFSQCRFHVPQLHLLSAVPLIFTILQRAVIPASHCYRELLAGTIEDEI